MMAKITQKDLDRIRAENAKLREKLKEQQNRTQKARDDLSEAKKDLKKASSEIQRQKRQVKELKDRIKKVEAETKAIDKRLAAEDRKADRTRQRTTKPKPDPKQAGPEKFDILRKAKSIDKSGRIIAPGIKRNDNLVPLNVKLPTASDMLDLGHDELVELMQQYGLVEPWDTLRANAARSTGQLKNIPNPALFEAQLNDIIAGESKRGVLSLARRTQERYNTLSILDGDPGTLLIRLPDDYDPDRLCDNCEALAATVGTYEEHAAIGLPGAQSCLGADYCRCSLMAVTEE